MDSACALRAGTVAVAAMTSPQEPPHLPAANASFEQRVALDRARILFSLARGNMYSMAVGAITLALLMRHGGTADATVALWFTLFCAAMAAVMRFERKVQQQGLNLQNCTGLLRIRVLAGIGAASFYGIAILLIPMHTSALLDSMLLLGLSGVVSIAALAYAVVPAQYLWTAVTCFGPLLARFAYRSVVQQDQTFVVLAVLALIWLVVVLNKSRTASRTAYEALVLNRRLHDEVEEHQQTREALRRMALLDPLTGLGNRRHFDETLHRTLSQAEREGGRAQFGVLAVDLDNFKPVNDRFGHPVGDALLQSVAQRLLATVRAGDFCARVGGDEFAVIVHGVRSAEDMQAIVRKLHSELAQANPFHVDAPPLGASVGWALYPEDGDNAIDLIALADARMYLEKNAHKLPQTARQARC